MPRTAYPPTPGSSSDIKGQDGTKSLASIQLSFELPPPMLHGACISPTYPTQLAETVKTRRRSSAAKDVPCNSKMGKESAFALPPPPTRTRKIIQMKPEAPSKAETGVTKGGKGKKKQPSATNAAGRKIARKTAHSLIERRRRSKMNEEFALLKGMIPACTGEMHKLAILQASIEYVRYLEDCVGKLKTQHDKAGKAQLPSISEFHPTFREDVEDVEMTDSEAVSPTSIAPPNNHPQPHSQSHSYQPSPIFYAQDPRKRHHSYSSQRHYSYSSSATTSPVFGPHMHSGYVPSSTLVSPELTPQSDLDQEATAALLMLNSDRRDYSGRRLSVKDLLSG